MLLIDKIELLKKDNEITLENQKLLEELINIVLEIKTIDTNMFLKYYDNTLKILDMDLNNIKNKIDVNKTIFINNIKVLFYLNEINQILIKESISFLSDLNNKNDMLESLKFVNIIDNQENEAYKENQHLFDLLGLNSSNFDPVFLIDLIKLIKSIKTK